MVHALRKNNFTKVQKDFYIYNLAQRTTYGNRLEFKSNPDIAYIQFGNMALDIIPKLKNKNFKGPVVVCFRGNDLSGYLQKDPHMYDDIFNSIDMCLPVCDFFKERLIQIGCPPEKIITHHSAINAKKFKFKYKKISANNRLNITSVARIAPKKGLECGLHAIAFLKDVYPNIHYTIIGDTQSDHMEYKEYLYELVKQLQIKDYVTFHGWATSEEIITLLNKTDIFVLPSLTAHNGDQEGIPNALKEAMAVGLPVIATDHAGNKELIDHMQSGILIEEKDVQGLVDGINWILNNPEKVKIMCKNGRKKIEDEFDIEVVVTKLESIFNNLIENKKNNG
jgi:colanic acid/amylovoran biosynthesis glycosyltransferase